MLTLILNFKKRSRPILGSETIKKHLRYLTTRLEVNSHASGYIQVAGLRFSKFFLLILEKKKPRMLFSELLERIFHIYFFVSCTTKNRLTKLGVYHTQLLKALIIEVLLTGAKSFTHNVIISIPISVT